MAESGVYLFRQLNIRAYHKLLAYFKTEFTAA